jgi:N-acetylglucosaminyldiphosphoundecaprenol N-acetyl-beta-D-mannosaminyltransferase
MALSMVGDWIDDGAREYVCVTGVHGVIETLSDPELRQIHNESGLTTPDGMPLVWCSRFAGAPWVDRVYGPDLMLEICRHSLEAGWSHYFYGSSPDVVMDLVTRLQGEFPGLKVVGEHSPPYRDLTDQEVAEDTARINEAGPDIVWVGLSTPKQERWMARFRPDLDASVLIGVGAAFDINSGRVAQAPGWMQRSGLEWLFRLMTEPGRLWRRYLRSNPRFVLEIVRRPPHFM